MDVINKEVNRMIFDIMAKQTDCYGKNIEYRFTRKVIGYGGTVTISFLF